MKKILLKIICIALISVLCIGSAWAQKVANEGRYTLSGATPVITSNLSSVAPAAQFNDEHPLTRAVVFSDGFEGGGAFPTGWTVFKTGGGAAWQCLDGLYNNGVQVVWPHSGGYFATNLWTSGQSRDAWMCSPAMNLTAGTEYNISFWLRMEMFTGEVDRLEVYMGSAPTAAAMLAGFQVYYNVSTPTSGGWVQITKTFTPTTSSTYHIGFHAFSPADQGNDIDVDDIEITSSGAPTPPCPAVTNLTALYGNNNVNLTWTAPATTPTEYKIYRNNALIATVTTTSHIDATASIGTHTYCVEAIYNDGCIPQRACQTCEVPFPNCTQSETIIGTTTTSGYYVPINTYYDNSYTQQIFTAEELGISCGDIISEVAFEYIFGTPQGTNGKTNQTIYLGSVVKDGFTGTEWIPVAQLQQVFTGTVQYNNSQTWSTIVFDQPFVHTGGNIVLAVLNNHGGYNTGSSATFRYHTPAGTRKTQQYYVDGSSINLATLTATSGTTTNRSNTKFKICKSSADVDMAVMNIAGELSPTAFWETYNYTVTVKNVGTVPVNAYTVSVVTEGGEVLATQDVTASLAPNATAVYVFPITFPNALAGALTIKGIVSAADDQRACNDALALTLNLIPHPGYVLECSNSAAAQIATGTAANNYPIPTNNYYWRSYTQQIYDAAEIGLPAGTEIRTISFQVMAGGTYTKTNQIIYLANTDKTTFANATDNIPAGDLQMVYSGSITFNSALGWNMITFDAPFIYTGGNIAVVMANNSTMQYPGSSCTFRTGTTTGTKAISRYTDTQTVIYSPTNLTSGSTATYTYRNFIRFGLCDKQYTLNPNDVYEDGAVVTTSNPYPVPTGGNLTVYFSCNDACRHITDIIINGASVGVIPSYTFNNVVANLPVIEVLTDYIQVPVTVTVSGNGTVSPAGEQGTVMVNCGFDQTFTFLPDLGYVVDYFIVNGVQMPKSGSYTFLNITQGQEYTLEVVFKVAPYNIYFTHTPAQGGEIIPVGRESEAPFGQVGMDDGDSQTFLFVPAPHYHIKLVKIDGVMNNVALQAGAYTFDNVHANHTIYVEFELDNIIIFASAGPNGTVTPSGNVPVPYGTDKTFTFSPYAGYIVGQVFVDNVPVPVTGNTYTFESVTENHSIFVTFTRPTVCIHLAWGTGGTIEPEGVSYVPTGNNTADVCVPYNATQKLNLVPDAGYKISSVKVDGNSYPNAVITGSYTFYYITTEHWLEVTFEKLTYPITATVTGNGMIVPQGTAQVPHGTNKTYTFYALPGSEIAHVYIDGMDNEDAVAAGTYTFPNVTEPHTIDVVIVPSVYTITASAGQGGSITPSGAIKLSYGANQTFNISVASGYEIEFVKIDGEINMPAAQNLSHTFVNIREDHEISVSFKIKRFRISASVANPGGVIDPAGITEINYGEEVTYTITPNKDYEISKVLVNGENIGASEVFTFTAIDADGTIEAFFAPIILGIENHTNDITVYSNMNIVYVKTKLPVEEVSIFDMYGRVVWQGKPSGEQIQIALNVANGIYTVRVATANTFTTAKVNIQR